MTSLGAVHTIFSLVALGSGAWVLLIPKGTRWHRTLGHVYGTSMAGTVVTALSLYEMTGRVGPFHLAAVVAGVTVGAGLYSVLRRRPKKAWIEAHATWMAWSYVGLAAAFVAESATRFAMPWLAGRLVTTGAAWTAFWTLVGVATLGVIAVGSRLVRRYLPSAIERTPAAMRREREELRTLEGDPDGALGGS